MNSVSDIVEAGEGHEEGSNNRRSDGVLQPNLGRGKPEDMRIHDDGTAMYEIGTKVYHQDYNIQKNAETIENRTLEPEAIAGPSSPLRVQSFESIVDSSFDMEVENNMDSNHVTTSVAGQQPSPLEEQKTAPTPCQPQPPSSDQDRATTTAKYKRLLSMAKRSIEENLRQINNKNAVIAALNEELQLAARQGGMGYGKMGPKAAGSSPPAPIQAVLRKVNSPGYVWVLLELVDEEGSLEWRGFESEIELVTFVRENTSAWGGAEGISIPVTCLTPQETMELQAESEAKVMKIREDYRRYRVQAELRQKHKDAEVRMIAANTISTKQKELGSHWGGGEAENPENHSIPNSVRRRDITTHGIHGSLETDRSLESKLSKRVKELEAELKQQAEVWHMVHSKTPKEFIALRREGSETEIAMQWRKRYEAAIQDKENALAKLDMLRSSGGGDRHVSGSAQSSDKDLHKKYNSLKEEYRLYRKKTMEALNSRDGGTRTGGGGVNLGGDINNESKLPYAKQVFIQFLMTDDLAHKETLERVLMAVLEFSDDEREKVQKTREVSQNAWISHLFGIPSSGTTEAS